MPFVSDPCIGNNGEQDKPLVDKTPTFIVSTTAEPDNLAAGETFKYQKELPKLPIPSLDVTLNNYLSVLKPLQTSEEHERTKYAAQQFLFEDGPALQAELQNYATDKSSYIEEFWYDSYLHQTDPVVLNLNPFFLLEDDPTPQRSNQIVRASSLIYSTLIFIQALRRKTLPTDVFRGTPLCMSQFSRLFGTARVPTTHSGCYIKNSFDISRHVVILAHSQFYYFDVFDNSTGEEILLTEKEMVSQLRVILKDAELTPVQERAKQAMGVLTTENRVNWAKLRHYELLQEERNAEAFKIVDTALFVVCLDDVEPTDTNELCTNMLCGTYALKNGVQVGTCTNRWYDKLQIIVCKNGSAGINFEHTGVDGHTVLRYASDIYTETILRFAKTINSQTQSIFHSTDNRRNDVPNSSAYPQPYDTLHQQQDTNPRKIEWVLSEALQSGIGFAETRLSDLILQNDVKVLEFKKYGKYFITDMKMSPDAFVQMAIQAAYYGLYGKCDMTYEPAMTKTFLHGRTEAIHSVSDASIQFVNLYHSPHSSTYNKLQALRASLRYHTQLTKDCSRGLGQDRHLYALECVWNRLDKVNPGKQLKPLLFTDSGWALLNHSVLSTSNCGNSALKLFGFGPVISEGFGIGYIIKEDGIAFCASSKHRQTQRFLDTLEAYLIDIHALLLKEKYPSPTRLSFQLAMLIEEEEDESVLEFPVLSNSKAFVNGYTYYDNGEQSDILAKKNKLSPQPSLNQSRKKKTVGRRLPLML